MTKDKMILTHEQQTLFIPLYGKALDYRSKNSILKDYTAHEIIEKAEMDLSEYKRAGSKIFAVRARQYDEWSKDFIVQNKHAVVVHLGCGLDARIDRVQPPDFVTWFDVDFPEVIALRKIFYTGTGGYKMIGASITDADWMEAFPANRPVFIVAEGVFEYLKEKDIKILLARLMNHFPHGQIAFDVMSKQAITSAERNLKKSPAVAGVLKWSVDDMKVVDQLNPKLTRVEMVPLINSVFTRELSLGFRLALALSGLFPKYKNAMRLLRYKF